MLSQVTYQNQLLSRDITFKQQQQNPMAQFGGLQGLNYLNGLNGLNLNNLGALGNLANLGGLSSSGMSGMNNMSSLSGVPQGMMGNSQFLPQDILGNQMNLVNNLMLNQQGNNRQIDQSNKDKESLPIQNNLPTNLPNISQNQINPMSQILSTPNVTQNLVPPVQSLSAPVSGVPGAGNSGVAGAGNGGAVKEGSMLGMGIDPQNFEYIKNMVL